MRLASVTLVALLAAACAHTTERVVEVRTESAAEKVTERFSSQQKAAEQAPPATLAPVARPAAAYTRAAGWGRREAGGEVVEVPFPREGFAYRDLIAFVSEHAGVRIRYEESSAVLKSKRVTLVGPVRVARSDLVAWFQDVLAYDNLVAVPWGPADRRELAVVDAANPTVTSSPRFVSEDELPALAGRAGLYVVCALTLPEGVEPMKARNALAQYSTKTAAIGRVTDVGDVGVLLVADFAAVVAVMRRTLDELAIRRFEAQQ